MCVYLVIEAVVFFSLFVYCTSSTISITNIKCNVDAELLGFKPLKMPRVTSELAQRFTGTIGLQAHGKFEGTLITGRADEALLQSYTEINGTDSTVQLVMFL
jgi:hypothetical protein